MISQERTRYLCGLMLKGLAAFMAGDAALAQVVEDVRSLIDSFAEVADPEWVEEMRSTWWRLELVYSVMLDQGRSELTDDDREEVNAAVETLRLMATE